MARFEEKEGQKPEKNSRGGDFGTSVSAGANLVPPMVRYCDQHFYDAKGPLDYSCIVGVFVPLRFRNLRDGPVR